MFIAPFKIFYVLGLKFDEFKTKIYILPVLGPVFHLKITNIVTF
jgi:hypothetical protein